MEPSDLIDVIDGQLGSVAIFSAPQAGCSTLHHFVMHVFFRRSPLKIGRTVVCRVAVEVSAL